MNRTRTSSLDAFGLRDQRNRAYPVLEAGGGSTGWVDSYSGGNATTNSYSDVIDGQNASFAAYQDQFNGGQASN